jgi:hypothetical protein
MVVFFIRKKMYRTLVGINSSSQGTQKAGQKTLTRF